MTGNKIIYFDSFGTEHILKEIKKFIGNKDIINILKEIKKIIGSKDIIRNIYRK